nr:retrovirus-related Pol polyprotein from transposon TNT 1-94 [Tanacetum cinerariifolium]
MLKNEVEARDSVLFTLKQKLNQAEKERDDLKLKFDKFQTTSQSLTKLLASQKHDKHGLGYCSSENDSESLSPICSSDRLRQSGGYNVVPPPITGNFMPPKPDLVFHTTPIVVETDHSAFIVQLSPTKSAQDISHTTRPMAPIIEDWVSDSEDESEPNNPQSAPSFVQTFKHVKPSRHSVQFVQAPILAATSKPTSPKSNYSSKRKNMKTCFVCRSVDHLIKDLLTKSKPVSVTAARPVSAAVPKIMITRPKHACNPKGGKISGKGKIKTDFKLPDESQVLLRVPRENNMYNVNLKDIVPSGDLICLFAKATIDESNLWHRRLGHVNFKTINKLVKGNLVRGLPTKVFENLNTCVACKKGKQHRASYSLLPIPFWAKAVNTACYVQNRVLVTKPQNKTPYELLHGRTPSIGFMRPFGCPVTILNTLDSLGKFERKVDEGFLVGYSMNSKAFRVFNSRTRIVQETLHNKDGDAAFDGKEHDAEKPESAVNLSPSSNFEDYSEDSSNNVSAAGPIVPTAGQNYSNSTNPISAVVDLPHDKRAISTKWVYGNKKDERGIVVRNKARLVTQGYTQEEGINYEEVFAPVARIEAIRLFLAYASFMGFMVYQIDVKSAFLYGTIEEEVYVCQPPGFEDPDNPEKVYKVVKALYGLHQAPRAWYETLANYLLENGFHRGQIDQTLFIKKQKGDILLVQIYVDDIIFGATNKDLLTEGKSASTPIDTEKPLLKDPDGEDVDVHIYRSTIGSLMYLTSSRPDIMFAVCACAHFQVPPKASHLHAVKRIFRYLKGKLHLGLWYPKDSPFNLVAYSDSDYAGASLDRKSTTRGCQFLGCRLISWQCKKQTVVATSSTEAEYVAGASCCAQVLWIQNQMLDYGLQALVDKKKVVVTEAATRDALHLDDAEGVDCLPNEEIFTALARMGYENPSIKLTFYKAFFSSQWKVGKGCSGVDTPLFEGMLVAREPEEQSNDDNAVEEPVTAVDDVEDQSIPLPTPPTPPSQKPQDIPSTSEAQSLPPQPQSSTPAQPQGVDFPMKITKIKTRVKKLERANKVKTLKLKRLRKIKTSQRIESSDDTIMKDVSNQGRMIDELDKDEGAVLMNEKEETKEVKDITGDAQVEGRQVEIYQIDMDHAAKVLSMQEDEPEIQEAVEVVTTAKLITEVVAAVSETVSAAAVVPAAITKTISIAAVVPTVTAAPVKVAVLSTKRRRGVVIRDPEEESSAKTPTETKSKDKGKGIRVEEPKPMKKKQQVELDEAYARKLHEELNQDIDWEVAMDYVKQKAKENPYVQRYQTMKKRPQTEAQARRNMMMYLKNTAGFRMDYFKGMSYDHIRPIFEAKFNSNIEFFLKSKEQMEEEENRAIASINETLAQKAAKRRRLNEEAEDVEELKQHLEIMPDEEDDVYTEATLLARKVPVVDYQIVHFNNKPHYKIIYADGTHQLYVSFITLLKNFDREDLESL